MAELLLQGEDGWTSRSTWWDGTPIKDSEIPDLGGCFQVAEKYGTATNHVVKVPFFEKDDNMCVRLEDVEEARKYRYKNYSETQIVGLPLKEKGDVKNRLDADKFFN